MLEIAPPQKATQLTHTKKLGNIEFVGYLKSHPQTASLIFSIEKYLENHPPFYLSSLLAQLKGLTIETIRPKLETEYNALVEGKSFLHLINNAFESRKRCLNKIRRDITKSTKFLALFPQQYFGETQEDEAFIDWVEVEGYSVVDVDESVEQSIRSISSIFVDMARLRDMTIYLVQQVHSWRMRIEEHLDRCQQHSQIKFYIDNQSIYEIILEDSKFIWSSKLSQYILMQAKQDPFLIRNVILVEQKSEKGLLEKYFVQIVYPKNEEIIDQAVRCFQMLIYKFKPKLYNRFQEEELLIENYLKMEMNAHQFDEPEEGLKISKLSPASPEQKVRKNQKQDSSGPEKDKLKNKLSVRGWIFEKPLKTPHRQRINQIIQNQKGKMSLIKSYNIANYGQKNSIALAYLSEVRNLAEKEKKGKKRKISLKFDKEDKKYTSEGEERKQTTFSDRGIESQPEKRGFSSSKMFRSLTKLHPIIYEDPKEHIPDTPKHKEKQREKQKIINNFESDGEAIQVKQATLQHAKINSFLQTNIQKDNISKIEVEEEETPLNLSKFYEVFRADTNKPIKNKDSFQISRKSNLKEGENEKLIKIRQFIDKVRTERTERAKSMHLPYTKKNRYSIPKSKIKDKQKSIQKSLQKSRDSYKGFKKVQEKKIDLPKNTSELKKMFLSLKAKSIPIDLVPAYVKYLESCLPQKSRIFIDFKKHSLIERLSDPSLHSIIFNISTDSHTSVGTIVLSQSLGGRGGKLKYMMQFMSVQPFELISVTMLRVAQQLLSATPCQEVVYPLKVDKLDLVSSHFIDLIDSNLMEGVEKFGKLVIMQRSLPSITGSDIRERIYAFTSSSNDNKLYGPKLQMMGNYRSLKFQFKCLVLTSNFRLRSDNLFKDTLHKYSKVSLGELFAKTFLKVMTNYHLKQLRQASFGGEGELGEVVRKDPFMRSILYATVSDVQQKSDELLKTTSFSNMEDLLNYLRYKNHDEYFHFQFLAESRFILQHQLVLVQLDQQFSLQFTLTSNQQLYILQNYKNLQLTQISCQKMNVSAFLIPTTNQKVSLFIMSASQYIQSTTDKIDLFSYLSFFFRYKNSQKFLNGVPSIVLPNLHQQNKRVNKVRMFDGFFKLFPERQFYSAAAINCINHWESYYTDAVIHEPLENSLIIEFPFILGLYDWDNTVLLSAFLYCGELDSPRS